MDCFKLLTYYVEYFKDNHSSIYMQDIEVNENDEKSLENFPEEFEEALQEINKILTIEING